MSSRNLLLSGKLRNRQRGKYQLPPNEISVVKELHAKVDGSPVEEDLGCSGRGRCFIRPWSFRHVDEEYPALQAK